MAYIDSTTNGATSGTTSSVAVPAGVVANTLVVLSLSRDSTTAFGTWPAGFTEFLNDTLTVVDTQRVGAAWKRATAPESGTYTCGAAPGANDWVMQAIAFSGRDTVNPPVLLSTKSDAANAIGAGLAITAPSQTALGADDLLFLCLPDTSVADGTVATTPPSGYTEAEDQEANFGYAEMAYKENVAAGATGTISGTLTASGGNAGYIAVHIRIPAAGASSVPARRPSFPNKGSLRQNYGARTIGFRQGLVIAASPDVTVALTGQAAAFTAGSLIPSSTVPLLGQAATFAAGTLAPNSSAAALGQAAAFTAGTLAPSSAVALLGQAAPFAAGALVPSSTMPVLGQAAAFSAGTLIAAPQIPLLGQASAFGAGTVIPGSAVPLVGQIGVFTPGFVTVPGDVTVALTGQSATFIAGTMLAIVQAVDQPMGPIGPVRSMFDASHRRIRKKAPEIEAESVEYITEPAPILVPPQKPVEFSLPLGDLLDFQIKLQLSEKRLELIEQQRQDHEAALIALWMMLDD